MKDVTHMSHLVDAMTEEPETLQPRAETTTISFRVPSTMVREFDEFGKHFGLSRSKLCQTVMEAGWNDFCLYLDVKDHDLCTMLEEISAFEGVCEESASEVQLKL